MHPDTPRGPKRFYGFDWGEDFAARIPNAKTHFAKRGGHALSRTEPELFNQIAIEFFRGVSA